MRAALLGWLFFFLAMLGGFVIGRYRRFTARQGPKNRPPAAAPKASEAALPRDNPRSAAPKASEAALPRDDPRSAAPEPVPAFTGAARDLPSDYRRMESVPPTLQ